jgi:hypothetical protein
MKFFEKVYEIWWMHYQSTEEETMFTDRLFSRLDMSNVWLDLISSFINIKAWLIMRHY